MNTKPHRIIGIKLQGQIESFDPCVVLLKNAMTTGGLQARHIDHGASTIDQFRSRRRRGAAPMIRGRWLRVRGIAFV